MKKFWIWLNHLGSPAYFMQWSAPWMRACMLLFILITGVSLAAGLFWVPADGLQGDSFRIIYIHVPSAWMSMFVFVFMAVQGAIARIWQIKICEIFAIAAAPTGAMFTAVTLITGSLWGKPTWGTYWTWDARLTSELILLFLYLGVIALYHAYQDHRAGARAASLLAIIGVVNIPIIHYSVHWWNTLHQGETIRLIGKSSMHPSMLWPLLLMALATKLYFVAVLLQRSRLMLLQLERGKQWAQPFLQANPAPSGKMGANL